MIEINHNDFTTKKHPSPQTPLQAAHWRSREMMTLLIHGFADCLVEAIERAKERVFAEDEGRRGKREAGDEE